MKKFFLIMTMACAISVLFACNGDHSDRTVRDTAKNVHNDIPSNIDTAKTTTTTGDASNLDNSASGGTQIAKDSSRMAKPDSTRK